MKRARVDRRRGWEVLCPTLHDVRRLTTLQCALDAFLDGVEDVVVTKMAKRPARWVGLPSAPALGQGVREYMLRRSLTLREFIMVVLLPSLRAAAEFSVLFANPPTEASHVDGGARRCSVAVNQPVATFTRKQVWCLLSNMFFCAFRSRTEAGADHSTADDEADEEDASDAADMVEAGLLPTADYAEMFTAPEGANNVEVTKLLLLFDFFTEAQAWTAEECASVEMRAHRSRAPLSVTQGLVPKTWCAASLSSASAPSLSLHPLMPVVLHAVGESIDDQHDMIRVDFANRWIGGGALSAGAVQEEITFAQCPALNVLRWYQSRLGHAESIVVTDYRQYGRVRAGSYGNQLQYGEALSPPQPCSGALLAVDALDFRFDSVDECSQAAVYREVVKLVSGLSCSALMSLTAVAGGNWGCGVFGGDYELKFLIQWAACGITGKELHYFPFDNAAFAAFVPHVTERLEGGCTPPLTTATLISFLYALEDASEMDDESEREEKDEGKQIYGFVWTSFLQHFRPSAEE